MRTARLYDASVKTHPRLVAEIEVPEYDPDRPQILRYENELYVFKLRMPQIDAYVRAEHFDIAASISSARVCPASCGCQSPDTSPAGASQNCPVHNLHPAPVPDCDAASHNNQYVVPTEWTAADRILVATKLLEIIQFDIRADRYGMVNRPNIASVLYVLHDSPDVLNQASRELAKILEESL